MNSNEFLHFAQEVIERSEAAYLATVHPDGYPVVRAMVNLNNPMLYPRQSDWLKVNLNPLTIVFSTMASSDKVNHIKRNPHVSVLYAVPAEFKEVIFGGEIEIFFDPRIREAIFQESWRIYFPKGAQDPGHAILSMFPKRAEVWDSSSKSVFHLKENKWEK